MKTMVYVKHGKGAQGTYIALEDIIKKDPTVRQMLREAAEMKNYCKNVAAANHKLADTNQKLLNEIARLTAIDTNRYVSCKLDEQGYVTDYAPVDLVIKLEEVPADLYEQCYQVIDGELVLDEAKKSAVNSII